MIIGKIGFTIVLLSGALAMIILSLMLLGIMEIGRPPGWLFSLTTVGALLCIVQLALNVWSGKI